MDNQNKKSLMEEMWERKLPQYLGSYLAVGFGLLQFLAFITSRYNLDASLVDKYLLVWLLLLPAIATLIYFGGKLNPQGKDRVVKWPKILVVGNFIIAFMLGGIMFNGPSKAIAEESSVITLTNEEGKEVTAIVPSLNKVQTVASFRFDNLTGEEDQDWWGIAFSDLLMHDLEQRPEFYVVGEFGLNGYYDRLGLEDFKLPNVGMQREVAQKSRSDYFTRISYNIENGEFLMKGNLYASRDGQSVMEVSAVNSDPYKAINALKQQIVQNIPDALESVENQVSLPTSSLVTGNSEALKYYIQSNLTFSKNPNALDQMIELGDQAIDLDPTCALCYLNVGQALYGVGKRDESIKYIKNAIKYGKSLPERMQFYPKEILYTVTNNLDALWKLQEVRKKLFPYEFSSYYRLLGKYKADYGIDSAKVLMHEAIENGNIERGLLELYDLQLENEEYLEAEKTLDRFSKEFPERDQDKIKYADIYERQGRIKEAKDILLEAETMDPLNTTIQTRLAYLDFKDLEIAKANERVNQGISQSTTLSDSLNFFWIKSYFLKMTGQIDKAFIALSDYEKSAIKRLPQNRLLATVFYNKTDMLQSLSQSEKVDALIDEIVKYSPEDENLYRCMASTHALEREYDMQLNAEAYSDCHLEYQKYGEGYGDYFNVLNYYKTEDYLKCVEILDGDNSRVKKLFDNQNFLAKIYAKAGLKEKAKDILKKAIDEKTDEPVYYYQMAALLENEDKQEAKKYLDIAMEYWTLADSDFLPGQWGRELASRL